MNYFTFREASEITGLNEATIRRLSKKPESKPYIQMKRGKKGAVYTIQADYLFGIYPRLKFDKNSLPLRVGSHYGSIGHSGGQEIAALLAAKDTIIQYLKDEAVYLRNENISLQAEIRGLKHPNIDAISQSWPKKVANWVAGFWQKNS